MPPIHSLSKLTEYFGKVRDQDNCMSFKSKCHKFFVQSLMGFGGFTLIELLVVISIISLLASIVFASTNSARQKARVARARADLQQYRLAIEFLFDDTGLIPLAIKPEPCMQSFGSNQAFMNEGRVGLESTNGNFPNWKGPYISARNDPWGQQYIYDEDYTCNTSSPIAIGCEGINVPEVRAIHSGGPNGTGINVYDSDNVVLVLCRP